MVKFHHSAVALQNAMRVLFQDFKCIIEYTAPFQRATAIYYRQGQLIRYEKSHMLHTVKPV